MSNLALRTRRTVAIGDVANAPELADETLGGRETLLALGSRAVLATPIEVFDEVIGIFAVHRTETCTWSANEISVTEAIAGEVGLAIHTARLLREDERRLSQQGAALQGRAGRHERPAARVRPAAPRGGGRDPLRRRRGRLLAARAGGGDAPLPRRRRAAGGGGARPAAPARGNLRRRDQVGEARAEARLRAARSEPPPSKNFAAFEDVLVAPMTWLGEVRGVLGVCSREAGHFQTSELELLDVFARFASLAAQNAGSFEERERQAQIQQGFYRIAEVLGSSLSLSATLDALAQAAAEALGGSSALVLEQRGDLLCLAGSYEVPEPLRAELERGLPAGATPFLAAAEEERIVSSTGLARRRALRRCLSRAASPGGLRVAPLRARPAKRGGERRGRRPLPEREDLLRRRSRARPAPERRRPRRARAKRALRAGAPCARHLAAARLPRRAPGHESRPAARARRGRPRGARARRRGRGRRTAARGRGARRARGLRRGDRRPHGHPGELGRGAPRRGHPVAAAGARRGRAGGSPGGTGRPAARGRRWRPPSPSRSRATAASTASSASTGQRRARGVPTRCRPSSPSAP